MPPEAPARPPETADACGRAPLAARSARAGAITVAAQAAQALFQLLATIVLARLLTPNDYGLVGMAMAVIGFIAIVRDFGIAEATVPQQTVTHVQGSTLFWIDLALGLAAMTLVVAAAPAVARFYGEPALAGITVALSCLLPATALTSQHGARLRREMRFSALALSGLVSVVGGLIVTVALAARGWHWRALIVGRVTEVAVLAVALWASSGWRPGLPSRSANVGPMLAFGANLTGFSVLNYVARNVDTLLIGRYWGAQSLGLYSRAYQLLLVPIRQVNTPIAAVAVPALSRIAGEPERLRRAYLRLVETIATLTMPAAAFAIVTADWLVLVALGPGWAGVAPLLTILAVAAILQPVANTASWLLVSQHRSRDLLHWGLIGSIVIVTGIVVGVPWGARGVALSYTTTFVALAAPLLFWFVGRRGPVRTRDFYRVTAPGAAAAAAVLVAVGVLRRVIDDSWAGRGLLVAAACAVAVALAVLLALPAGRTALRNLRETGRLLREGA